jgi:hypothetical protein
MSMIMCVRSCVDVGVYGFLFIYFQSMSLVSLSTELNKDLVKYKNAHQFCEMAIVDIYIKALIVNYNTVLNFVFNILQSQLIE